MKGISALKKKKKKDTYKRGSSELPSLFHYVRIKWEVCNQEGGPLISRTIWNTFLLFVVSGILLQQPEWTKTRI